ncbi:MAG: hypothetical protein AAF408_00095 [Pseudomonadota bacterium]
MTRSRPFQNAFSSGEIDPLLHVRSDFQRYQTGLAGCRGFLPLRQGGFTRAPGTIYRGNTRNDQPARRVPFEFATNDALTLEFTDGFMRVWRYGALVESGGSPYELATPYLEADLENLQWVQDKDVIYMVDGRQPMQKLSRFALDNWTIADAPLNFGPFRVQNLNQAVTMQCGATAGSISVTGVNNPFAAEMVGSLVRVEPTNFTTVPLWVGNATAAVGQRVYYDDKIYELTAGTTTGANPPVHEEGARRTDAGQPTTWQFVSDMVGIFRITGFTNPNLVTADVIKTIPIPCVVSPTYRWSEGAWNTRYGQPGAVEMNDQRLWAANTPSEPRTVWASLSGDFEDFAPGTDDDSAFAYSIAATQTQNAIKWLRRGRNGMFIGALGEIYRGFSSASGQTIGPNTFDTELVSEDGAAAARPISAYGYPIYITKGGRRFQELRYSFEEDGARPVELSLPSQHLGARTFLQSVWQSEPLRLAWIRDGDGALVVMSFDPAQDVLGWAVVPVADGFVEDMDVTSGLSGNTDVLTMVVRRTVDGQVRRFVEEQALIYGVLTGAEPIDRAIHIFAASEFEPGSPEDTFSLPHLVGEQVYAWTDVGEYGPLTVDGSGEVTLPAAVTRAVIGLFDETHFVETLDLEAQAQDGGSRGRPMRNHGKTGVDLYQTAAGFVSPVTRHFGQADIEGGRQELLPLNIAADLDTAFTGTSRVHPASGHGDAVRLRFYPKGGAPMTVTGITPEVEEANA